MRALLVALPPPPPHPTPSLSAPRGGKIVNAGLALLFRPFLSAPVFLMPPEDVDAMRCDATIREYVTANWSIS
jgi:hypothetical protein